MTYDLERKRLIIIGPGRAGGSVARAAIAAGHQIVGVLSRRGSSDLGADLDWGSPLPQADLALVSVRDDALAEVVERITGLTGEVRVAAHLSGYLPVTVLAPLREAGTAVGGFHPLQTLPNPKRGAEALAGAFAGIGGDPLAVEELTGLARSLGMEPFTLDDQTRPSYHAAAAAAANYVIVALAISSDLFRSAGIDPAVSRPLVDQAVTNAFEQGPDRVLTGPVARGDVRTVIGHLAAARAVSEELEAQFRRMAEATALRAGRTEDPDLWR